MSFKDYFSTQSTDYARYRPRYPGALFEYLASVAAHHERAWDCATGNGQAAIGLAPFFEQVIATDGSAAQIGNATPHEKIIYRVATAEKTGVESHSIDLVTVSQALHWFNLDAFYQEVRRVLKPGGVLAAWCYDLLEISPAIDQKFKEYYGDIVGPYWPPERQLVEDGYRTIAFPFTELDAPRFRIEAMWSLSDLLGYLRSWSATQRFIAARGIDPVAKVADELLTLWGSPEEEKRVRWPLYMRIGVVPPQGKA